MQPITYLCFTLLSILIQFSLLDFINTKDENNVVVENISTTYKHKEIIKKIKHTPHALYYRTEKNKLIEKANLIFPIKYNNLSLTESSFMSSTEMESTVFDLLYDDNVSMIDNRFTSELPYTTTELDNVTEITFFEKGSTAKPTEVPKKISPKSNCDCDLLHRICDINCCCDSDCTEKERNMFEICKKKSTDSCDNYNRYKKYLCYSELTCKDKQTSYFLQNLFCIDKINLPEKQTKSSEKFYSTNVTKFYSWPKNKKQEEKHEFSKEMYVAGQFIWVLTNGILNIIELPILQTNNYCSGKKAIKYLKNEEIKCLVKLQDLHMLNILKSLEDTYIVSPTPSTLNNTVMNCSTLACINWTLHVCDENKCKSYNKSIHEPTCSERYCNNIAVKLNYLFYCNESTIIKALIKLHVTRVSMVQQVVTQEINVNFYMTNDSIDSVLQLSGNPGYKKGLPLIASYSKNNHTKYFYNNTAGKNHISIPINKNGYCLLTNTTENIILFGHNKRMKCRLTLKSNLKIYNGTDECLKIQEQVKKMLGINDKVLISPYGNPLGIEDEKWFGLELLTNDVIYGEYRPKSSKLLCFNLITSISFIITFADVNSITKTENKILSARIEGNAENVMFDMEYLSVVITTETNFIDASVPPMVESIDAPNVNIHLPSNFFLPFPSNKCHSSQSYTIIIYMCIMLCLNK